MAETIAPGSAPSARSVLGTLLLVGAAIAALLTVDTLLAKLDRAARRDEAAHLFSAATRFAAEGRHREAIDRFRSALVVDRGNRDYRLALARALVAAGELGEAESTLVVVLRKDATDGEANLALARVFALANRTAEATAYYHRAIYGLWPEDAESHRTTARLELIDLLARTGAKQELLAELLPLEATGLPDPALRRRVGHLFAIAGAPVRAAAIFRDLLRQDSRDADSYAGLGEAEFARGNYRGAAANFRTALRLEPGDSATTRQLATVTEVLALDPTQRGLGAAERQRRAHTLLQLSADAAGRCLGPAAPAGEQALVDTAAAMLKAPVPAARRDQVFEASLDLAVRLRGLGPAECRQSARGTDDALDLVLARLSE